MEYKIKKNYLHTENVEYNKSSCQPFHTRKWWNCSLKHGWNRMKVLRMEERYVSTKAQLKLFKNVKLYFI